jgi:hypothetical protein
MTGQTGYSNVPAGQRKSRRSVVKRRRRPVNRAVTLLTVMIKIACDMVGILCPSKIILMTRIAV